MGRRDGDPDLLSTSLDDLRPPPPPGERRPSRLRTRLVLAWLVAGALVVVAVVRLLGLERGALLALLVGALPLTLLAAWPLLGEAPRLYHAAGFAIILGGVAFAAGRRR